MHSIAETYDESAKIADDESSFCVKAVPEFCYMWLMLAYSLIYGEGITIY